MSQLWTCIARCGMCGRELNRAEHVPESARLKVAMSAAFVAICDERDHNTFSDLNLRQTLEWIPEPEGESEVAPV